MATQDIPTLQRNVAAQTSTTPDYQSTFEKLGEAQNNLSAIGANVAQSASNEMAKQLGYISGQNPKGDLLPPITDFDKTFTDSYHAQAHATLSLQGEKLLDDAQVQMSKSPRLTPELIQKTHEQLAQGLNKISEQAPTAIKTNLQQTFNSQLLQQVTQYRTKMVSDQREDDKNNLQNGIDIASKNALELGQSGDAKGSATAVKSAHAMADSALASRYFTPEQTRIAKETATQNALNGHYINGAMQALRDNKFPEYEKNLSENKPAGMTNEQWLATAHAVNEQVTFIQGLRTQDENLKSQEMLNRIASAPGSITGNDWDTFAASVSPLKAEEVKFRYIQALKKNQNNGVGADALIQNFSSPEAWANSSDKVQNAAYNKSVDYVMQQGQQSGKPISHEDAEVQVAASAGAAVPVFIKGLKNKLHSSNPAMIESASQQIHALKQMDAGHALVGLDDQDNALNETYQALRDSRDPVTAARDATAAILNQDPDTQQANKQKWSNAISVFTNGTNKTPVDFALSTFNLDQSEFINPAMAQVYGSDILRKYQSLYQIANGDNNVAKNMTQQYIDDNYGTTGVNGGSHMTMHPLEKQLGFSSSDSVPYIQQDVINQLNDKLSTLKEAYNTPVNKYVPNLMKSNEYWETVPLNKQTHGLFNKAYDPVQLKRHMRTENGEQVDTFNVVLQGNDYDYDVAIQTGSGMRNLFQIAPALGIVNYQPNGKAIRESYNKDHSLT